MNLIHQTNTLIILNFDPLSQKHTALQNEQCFSDPCTTQRNTINFHVLHQLVLPLTIVPIFKFTVPFPPIIH